MMVDPVLNYFNAMFLIIERLPDPYFALLVLSCVFSGVIVFIKFVRSL